MDRVVLPSGREVAREPRELGDKLMQPQQIIRARTLAELIQDARGRNRLARNLEQLSERIQQVVANGGVIELQQPPARIDRANWAEWIRAIEAVRMAELELVRARHRNGVEVAVKSGRYGRVQLDPERADLIAGKFLKGAKITQIAEELGVNRKTVYRHLRARKLLITEVLTIGELAGARAGASKPKK